MKRAKQLVVTKRDGTLERFSLTKLMNSLAVVLGGRSYDPKLAGPLAKAVAMHLSEWKDTAPPTTSYIYRCVRAVLQQTGLSDVADDLAEHRRIRRAKRRRIRVLDPESGNPSGEPWRKGEIVATLGTRYGLRHTVARFMAGQIEQQVFALEYRCVSKVLLSELIRNEVMAWGVADEVALNAGPVEVAPPVPAPQPEKES